MQDLAEQLQLKPLERQPNCRPYIDVYASAMVYTSTHYRQKQIKAHQPLLPSLRASALAVDSKDCQLCCKHEGTEQGRKCKLPSTKRLGDSVRSQGLFLQRPQPVCRRHDRNSRNIQISGIQDTSKTPELARAEIPKPEA